VAIVRESGWVNDSHLNKREYIVSFQNFLSSRFAFYQYEAVNLDIAYVWAKSITNKDIIRPNNISYQGWDLGFSFDEPSRENSSGRLTLISDWVKHVYVMYVQGPKKTRGSRDDA
jgi:hypothetical protein